MQQARERGYTRSTGVSNFGAGEFGDLMAAARTPPVVDQVLFNLFAHREGLVGIESDRHRSETAAGARADPSPR